jgi:uncharacterized membrane protein YcaP (DUF421 family)
VFDLQTPWWEIVFRTAAVYIVVLVLLRIAGKRELGQYSPMDLVVILIISNAVQNAMTGGDNSLIGGVIAASTLVGMNLVLGRIGHRIPVIEHLFESEPTPLIENGRILEENMRREHVELAELEMAAREHGIDDLREVKAAYLERDGSISIIARDREVAQRARKRIRQLREKH